MRTRAPWRLALAPAVAGAALLRQLRLVPRDAVKRTMHAALLGPLTPGEAEDLARSFARRFAPRRIRRGAAARIAADRAEGFRVVIATAAYRFYAAPLAAALGVDEVIATETAIGDDDRLLPRIAGTNCYGPEKLRRIEAWLAERGIARDAARIRFYTDHVTDAPALAWVDEPYAVNPHGRLRRLAEREGWPILDWR